MPLPSPQMTTSQPQREKILHALVRETLSRLGLVFWVAYTTTSQ